MRFGRAFDLYGPRPARTWWARLLRRPEHARPVIGTVLPCELCGNPVFEPDKHACAQLMAAMVEEMEQRERDAWKEM